MTQDGWIHLGILLVVFAGAVLFFLRRMVLPAPKEGATGETVAGSRGYNGGYGGGHFPDGGHGGVGN
ncbi:hypothetical protein [Mesorhizobium sp. 113-1-2]|uniref:hypothetical protein n=1 Tax=Mesorhizobium sp. 113-1-2 TaxID=2744515 RepID=UPI000BBAF7A7|nr:hypothetical protein [Mesorhizobium sp. 113-1-2]